MRSKILEINKAGIFCPQGDFYVDPLRKVDKAIITHAHSDHARKGMGLYISHNLTDVILKHKLGSGIKTKAVEYGEIMDVNGVKVSLHPAGHIPGSAQVRIEYKGEVTVVSGDYKLEDDNLSTPFESLKCHTFITECTFGSPAYRWKSNSDIFSDINDWWRENKEHGKISVIMGYVLGKTQRILHNADNSIGNIYTYTKIKEINDLLRNRGLNLQKAKTVNAEITNEKLSGSLIIAPSGIYNTGLLKKFDNYSLANASGWMAIDGFKKRMPIDKGFALSDHADWDGLHKAVKETEAETVYVMHGTTALFIKSLRKGGIDARDLYEKETGQLEIFN